MSKNRIQTLIAKGKIESAMEALAAATQSNTDLHEEVLLQSAAYQELKRNVRNGVIDNNEQQLRRNQIIQAILGITQEIDKPKPRPTPNRKEPPQTDILTKPATPNRLFPASVGIGILAGIVALFVFVPCPSSAQFIVFRIALALGAAGFAAVIPGFFEFQYKQLFTAGGALAVFAFVYLVNPAQSTSEDRCNQAFDFTIFLEDAEGRTVLHSEGSLLLRLDNDKRPEPIDQEGSVSFKGLAAPLRGDSLQIELQATGWEFTNGSKSEQVRLIGKSQTLTVQRDSSLYCCVSGSVQDQTDFLSGVRISIGEHFTQSDSTGRFRLVIPREQQATSYRLTVSHPDYQLWEATVDPASQSDTRILLETR